jgi:hypothetical protein
MNKRWFVIGALTVGIAGVTFSTARAEDKEENEVKVSIKKVPAAVRKTLKREAMGEKIKTVDQETLNGKLAYEADVKIDGHNYEIVVDKGGLLLSKKLDEGDETAEKAEGRQKATKSDDDDNYGKAETSEKKQARHADKDDEDEQADAPKAKHKAHAEKDDQAEHEDHEHSGK